MRSRKQWCRWARASHSTSLRLTCVASSQCARSQNSRQTSDRTCEQAHATHTHTHFATWIFHLWYDGISTTVDNSSKKKWQHFFRSVFAGAVCYSIVRSTTSVSMCLCDNSGHTHLFARFCHSFGLFCFPSESRDDECVKICKLIVSRKNSAYSVSMNSTP